MRLFYIVDKDVAESVDFGHYAIEIANGKVLMAIQWKDEVSEMQWANRPGVLCLPHPIFEMAHPVQEEHRQHLGELCLEPHWTIHDVLREAAKIDPQFRVRVV